MLEAIAMSVCAGNFHQVCVRSMFNDPPAIDHDDLVRRCGATIVMRSKNRRPTEGQSLQGLADAMLISLVQAGRGFV